MSIVHKNFSCIMGKRNSMWTYILIPKNHFTSKLYIHVYPNRAVLNVNNRPHKIYNYKACGQSNYDFAITMTYQIKN